MELRAKRRWILNIDYKAAIKNSTAFSGLVQNALFAVRHPGYCPFVAGASHQITHFPYFLKVYL